MSAGLPHTPMPPDTADLLHIDPESPSWLRWSTRARGRRKDRRAGYMCSRGYWRVRLGNKNVLGHRIVYFLKTSKDPGPLEVDHIDGNPANNDPDNLRVATKCQNMTNSYGPGRGRSRYRGVGWHVGDRRWRARISVDRKCVFLGNFEDEHEAAEAVNLAALQHHGPFAWLNLINSPGERDTSNIQK